MRVPSALSVLSALSAIASPLLAQDQPRSSLTWLAGCWQGGSATGMIEEQWMRARANLVLGAARTVSRDTVRSYEFSELHLAGDSVTFVALPTGQQRRVFTGRLVGLQGFVVENHANDFPTRIGYELVSRDSLRAWIEGPAAGGTRRIPYTYRRVPCEVP